MKPHCTDHIEATQALGDRGIMGTDYPSVMSFYQFALRLVVTRDMIAGATETKAKDSFSSDSKGYHQQQRNVRCSSNGAICSSNRCPLILGSTTMIVLECVAQTVLAGNLFAVTVACTSNLPHSRPVLS